ncbi:MAG: hypothetical protein GKC53_06640 [Neisseriaceae bacterium]|nr:MAG: hypothetical protein GKC53_06640 [Neisseriaceae bacterium]
MIGGNLIEGNIELSSLYSKIEYELFRLEDDQDPLNLEHEYNIDWFSLDQDIDRLLSQVQDVQILVWKLRAGLHIEGFSSLYRCLSAIQSFISSFKAKESLTEEEKYSLSTFSSALSYLSKGSFFTDIKKSKIYPDGNILVRTIFEFSIKNNDGNFTSNDFVSLVKRADDYFQSVGLPSLKTQLQENIDYIDNISEYVNQHSSGYILDCHNLKENLSKLSFKVNPIYEVMLNNSETQVDQEINLSNPVIDKGRDYLSVQAVSSRKEVILILDNLLNYFRVHEPSHPAPILIRRVKKMIGMNFEEIIQELLPDSQALLQMYVGRSSIDHDDENIKNIDNVN